MLVQQGQNLWVLVVWWHNRDQIYYTNTNRQLICTMVLLFGDSVSLHCTMLGIYMYSYYDTDYSSVLGFGNGSLQQPFI